MGSKKTKSSRQSRTTSLRISPGGKRALTDKQLQFNALTKQIEVLEAEIERDERRAQRVLNLYLREVRPWVNSKACAQENCALLLDRIAGEETFGTRQRVVIGAVIIQLLEEAAAKITLGSPAEQCLRTWQNTTTSLGGDASLDSAGPHPHVGVQPWEDEQRHHHHQHRKKSRTERHTEAQRKAQEDVQQRGLRSIYITLAKVLHPDTETDQELKLEKEQLMKEVVVAYGQKDLASLLRFEQQWLVREKEHLALIPQAKLDLYLAALREQLTQLWQQKEEVRYLPQFSQVSAFTHFNEKDAGQLFEKFCTSTKKDIAYLDEWLSKIEKQKNGKVVMDFVNEYARLR